MLIGQLSQYNEKWSMWMKWKIKYTYSYLMTKGNEKATLESDCIKWYYILIKCRYLRLGILRNI